MMNTTSALLVLRSNAMVLSYEEREKTWTISATNSIRRQQTLSSRTGSMSGYNGHSVQLYTHSGVTCEGGFVFSDACHLTCLRRNLTRLLQSVINRGSANYRFQASVAFPTSLMGLSFRGL
jgi:hypothetical protein